MSFLKFKKNCLKSEESRSIIQSHCFTNCIFLNKYSAPLAAGRLNFAISLSMLPLAFRHTTKLLENWRYSWYSLCLDGCQRHHRACLQSAWTFQSFLCQCCRSHPGGKAHLMRQSTASLGEKIYTLSNYTLYLCITPACMNMTAP